MTGQPSESVPRQPRKRSFIANVLIVSGGSVAGQVISLLASPILARLFGPEAYGIAAIFGMICAVVGVVGCLRYDGAILLPQDDEDGSAVLTLSCIAAFSVTGLAAVFLYFFGEPTLALLGAQDLQPFVWLLPIGILLTSLQPAAQLFVQRAERFDLVTFVRLVAQVAAVAVTLTVGWYGFQSGRDLVAARVSTVVLLTPFLLLLWVALWPQVARWRPPSWRRIRTVAVRYREFPLVNAWAGFLDMLGMQAPALMLAMLFSPTVVGLYAMAARLVGLPTSFVSSSIAHVLFQHVAAAHARNDTEALRRAVEGVALRLIALGVLPIVWTATLGPAAIALVFGERWTDAGVFAALMAPSVLAMFLTSPLTVLLNVFEMHRFNVAIRAVALVVGAGSLYAGSLLFGTPEGALMTYAGLAPIPVFVQQWVLLRASGASFARFIRHLLLHLLWTVPTVLIWGLLDRWLQVPWWQVVLGTLAASAPYCWLTLRADPEAVVVIKKALHRARALVGRPRSGGQGGDA